MTDQQIIITPQEENLMRHHKFNLSNGAYVRNKDNTISTVRQAVVMGPGGKYYSIPTVWDGRILNERQAVERAAKEGWDNWPSYDTPETADQRYNLIHPQMEQDAVNFNKTFSQSK